MDDFLSSLFVALSLSLTLTLSEFFIAWIFSSKYNLIDFVHICTTNLLVARLLLLLFFFSIYFNNSGQCSRLLNDSNHCNHALTEIYSYRFLNEKKKGKTRRFIELNSMSTNSNRNIERKNVKNVHSQWFSGFQNLESINWQYGWVGHFISIYFISIYFSGQLWSIWALLNVKVAALNGSKMKVYCVGGKSSELFDFAKGFLRSSFKIVCNRTARKIS